MEKGPPKGFWLVQRQGRLMQADRLLHRQCAAGLGRLVTTMLHPSPCPLLLLDYAPHLTLKLLHHPCAAGTAAPTPGQLEAIVKLNAYGHEHMDLGMAGCRGEPQAAFIGELNLGLRNVA